MPMIEDLLVKLQESPPQSEEELTGLLNETGYDLVPVQPSMDEPMGEEMPLDEEMPGDEGPTEGSEAVDMMEEMMPPGDKKGPVAGIRLETLQVADKVMRDDRKKKGGKDDTPKDEES